MQTDNNNPNQKDTLYILVLRFISFPGSFPDRFLSPPPEVTMLEGGEEGVHLSQ
jgi:hypothetical protein